MRLLIVLFLAVSFLWSSVDINNASVVELSSLKGIGKVKSEAIIDYRKNYCFKSAQELTKVKGIGSKTLEKNLSDITVGKCKK
ncbi:MAG TPA: helix-hairpin-helix domain-containing protein [Sulfurospirillum arcachonense]|nr:helix-hairpin-helix domain-containing protein [Sulfurospirillum arcachonense]